MKPVQFCTGFIFCTFHVSVTSLKKGHMKFKKCIVLNML